MIFSQKEDACSGNADRCSDHLPGGDFFVEHNGRRHDNKNRNQRH